MINNRAVYIVLGCAVALLIRCNPADKIPSDEPVQRHEADWSDGLATYEATWPEKFGIGRPADKSFIAKWDIDVRPDGKGLPKGEGNVKDGAVVYQNKCASCHGVNGYEGPEDKLVTDSTGRNTIGNYWPYATTIFDYVRRAMPFNAPGSLTDQEVYDITAYLLYLNGIIQEEYIITEKTLPAVEMPAKKRYILDDRRGGPEIR
ncbi:cytochrome c [Sphingobacterium sp. DN00404]|uniref:Cytochrome c n=1 Tax=Sphingobacterium micropteri TaxID=2763501 RepID=A0ABR7YT80_9SPHI|nr:cytochrome c [Sphingobacterium micropteri]MBD1434546.1 cytochrome c [Sphingobacterium micropteri]